MRKSLYEESVMADYRRSIPILVEMLYSALLLISLIAGIAVSVVKVAPFFQQPEIVYVTQEMPAYPMTDGESKLVPVAIRARLAAGSAGKILCLAVQNRGDKAAAHVLVGLNLSVDDGYLGGWTSRSDDQSVEHMLGTETEYTLDRLVPADEATFCLYLKNVTSNLADRIEVYDGKGHR